MTTQQDNNKNNNPTGKGGFGDHPEHRNPGGWDKNNSFAYWYNYYKHLSVEKFLEAEKIPDSEKTVAQELAYVRVRNARTDLKEFQEVANRSEGMPKQSMDFSTLGESINPLSNLSDEELVKRVNDIITRPKDKPATSTGRDSTAKE